MIAHTVCSHPPFPACCVSQGQLTFLWCYMFYLHICHPKGTISHQFLQHTKSIDPHIQLNAGLSNTDGSIPFLDTLVSPGPDNTLLTTVYRKPTHRGQCLHWDSHHNVSAKYGLFNTLAHRTRTVCANLQLLQKEEEHINRPYKSYIPNLAQCIC